LDGRFDIVKNKFTVAVNLFFAYLRGRWRIIRYRI